MVDLFVPYSSLLIGVSNAIIIEGIFHLLLMRQKDGRAVLLLVLLILSLCNPTDF
jgi:hypothetical protein